MQWRDISEAPKDGTTILVAWPSEGGGGWEMHSAFCVLDEGIWWHYACSGDRIGQVSHPTDWMPLPPPPGYCDIDAEDARALNPIFADEESA